MTPDYNKRTIYHIAATKNEKEFLEFLLSIPEYSYEIKNKYNNIHLTENSL